MNSKTHNVVLLFQESVNSGVHGAGGLGSDSIEFPGDRGLRQGR